MSTIIHSVKVSQPTFFSKGVSVYKPRVVLVVINEIWKTQSETGNA